MSDSITFEHAAKILGNAMPHQEVRHWLSAWYLSRTRPKEPGLQPVKRYIEADNFCIPSTGKFKYKYEIVNVVCTMTCNFDADMVLMCMAVAGKLGMSVFPAVVSKSKDPASTNCCFKTGQNVNTGAKLFCEARVSAEKFINRIADVLDIPLFIMNFDGQNIVTSTELTQRNLQFEINLLLILQDDPNLSCKWEEGLFPGLKMEIAIGGMAFILFASGCVIITGARTYEDLLIAYIFFEMFPFHLYRKGEEYRLPKETEQTTKKRVKSKKKTNQFKVVNHSRKKAAFHRTLDIKKKTTKQLSKEQKRDVRLSSKPGTQSKKLNALMKPSLRYQTKI